MASSSASPFASLSRRLSRHLLPASSNPKPFHLSSRFLCTAAPESNGEPEFDDSVSDAEGIGARPAEPTPPQKQQQQQRLNFERPLEKGLDQGVYKAILVGKIGQKPIQKRLKSGRPVTLFSLGTGGIRNNRRPLDNEDPKEYANRCAVQWHRVSVYPDRLGDLALKHVKPGAIIYVEGNLETKIFSDPISGLVRRIREVAVRRDGRLVFLGKEGDTEQSSQADLKGVGYY